MSDAWQAPGKGRWEQDAEHMPDPVSGYVLGTLQSMFDGMAEGMRDYGIPLAGFDVRLVGGRIYGRVRPVGAPDPDGRMGSSDKPAKAPPPFLMRAMFTLHPELRRRARAAREAMDSKRWRRDSARWHDEQEPALRASNLELSRVDPTALTDTALADHIDRVHAAFAAGFRLHGRLAPVYSIPVGLWLRRTVDWTGADPARVLAILKGDSPASVSAVASIDRIADAARSTPGAQDIIGGSGTPDERLGRLRHASAALRAAIVSHLEEDGYRLVTGIDIVNPTARELPGLLMESIAARLSQHRAATQDASIDTAAQVRVLVPEAHRPAYDRLLADARAAFGIRDSDVWVTTQWPEGILRIALLEAAGRLIDRGALLEPDNVFDSAPGEVVALLRGAASPTADELARRTRERVDWGTRTPPIAFGPEGGPPPMEGMPEAVADMTASMMFLLSLDKPSAGSRNGHAAGDAERPGVTVRGMGVSAGQYSGRARVVIGPADFARIQAGDVLVARSTSPAYNILLPLIGAVVTDRGGLLSHAALVAREFGIPAVVATTDATSRIADGATVTVDADQGLVLVQ
jgi:phosphohistidine swiveling domain-containing protein